LPFAFHGMGVATEARRFQHDYAFLMVAGHDTQNGLVNPHNHYAERTFLVHCRAFAKFFSNEMDNRDMYARDFVDVMLGSTRCDLKIAFDLDLGNGTVVYRGLQARDPAQLTVWTIRMYGGAVLADDQV
jgi:hypothetical protein